VQTGDTFYTYINCLYCHGAISGYSDNTFRAGEPITRGQIAKIVSNAAGFQEDPGSQIYSDVLPGSPFYAYINRLTRRGIVAGYPCPAKTGMAGEAAPGEESCSPEHPQLFRPNFNATRGQMGKIVSNAAGYNEDVSGQYYADVPPSGEGSQFYIYIMRLTGRGVISGYQCGTSDPRSGPCDAQHRPYFRPGNEVTRGQAAKIVANTFFPNCQPSAKP
jgi:S-layer homology domain